MILADSSAWLEFDRATGSAVHLRLRELIRDQGPIAITEPVVVEVLAGAKDDPRERALRKLLRGSRCCRSKLRLTSTARCASTVGVVRPALHRAG